MSMAERRQFLTKFSKTTVYKNESALFECSCGHFLKEDECVHVIYLLKKSKMAVIPDHIKDAEILGKKRGRGRAARARRALVQQ